MRTDIKFISYKSFDKRWASDIIGSSILKMSQQGDLICALAMILANCGLRATDGNLINPQSLHKFLKQQGFIQQGSADINLSSAISAFGVAYLKATNDAASVVSAFKDYSSVIIFSEQSTRIGLIQAIDSKGEYALVQDPSYSSTQKIRLASITIAHIYKMPSSCKSLPDVSGISLSGSAYFDPHLQGFKSCYLDTINFKKAKHQKDFENLTSLGKSQIFSDLVTHSIKMIPISINISESSPKYFGILQENSTNYLAQTIQSGGSELACFSMVLSTLGILDERSGKHYLPETLNKVLVKKQMYQVDPSSGGTNFYKNRIHWNLVKSNNLFGLSELQQVKVSQLDGQQSKNIRFELISSRYILMMKLIDSSIDIPHWVLATGDFNSSRLVVIDPVGGTLREISIGNITSYIRFPANILISTPQLSDFYSYILSKPFLHITLTFEPKYALSNKDAKQFYLLSWVKGDIGTSPLNETFTVLDMASRQVQKISALTKIADKEYVLQSATIQLNKDYMKDKLPRDYYCSEDEAKVFVGMSLSKYMDTDNKEYICYKNDVAQAINCPDNICSVEFCESLFSTRYTQLVSQLSSRFPLWP
ncbi:hypothetical protein FGO68_gene132 [Halteria grandinella]|uniref:Uncharacterized protein n=1 Tax=Halteria grandinella TaxID=5974 RepID=A0A8J8P6L0_HALGN|nr:hypothetical protein FGO68_gene132 [Halteria grandinella]